MTSERTAHMPDEELLRLYGEWSEGAYAASFISPSTATVREFREWLLGITRQSRDRILENYEREMLRLYRELERA